MDAGHHNCRDYYIKPEDALSKPRTPVSTASILAARATRVSQKSPLNGPSHRLPTFPFLKLPLELRRHVYSYLLPCTQERNTGQIFSKITAKRLPPTHTNLSPDVLEQLLAKQPSTSIATGKDSITWRRGQTSLLAVCQQIHHECAELLYGDNTFVIFVAYDSITFRFRWLLPNGLSPNRTYDFLELIPSKYLKLVKRVIVTVDHVDSYTGQIKYNVGGKGLTHGLRGQVARLIEALNVTPMIRMSDEERLLKDRNGKGGRKRLIVNLLNGNDHLDAEKRSMVKARDASIRGVQEVQTVLEPLMELKGLANLEITGAVTEEFVKQIKAKTMIAT